MSNISEMEKAINIVETYISVNHVMYKEKYKENAILNLLSVARDFMRMNLDSIKDLHEENCKLWKAIAELKGGE